MWVMGRLRVGLVGLVAFCHACGGSDPVVEESPDFEAASGSEIRGRNQGVQIQGTLGTIPARKIDSRMQAKLRKLSRCFMVGMEDVEFVGGSVTLSFRVDNSGGVEWVFVQESNIGHRGTERCIVTEAARTAFPMPRGGSGAEFTWGFAMDPAGDLRPPVDWGADRVAESIAAAADLQACPGAGHRVTAYVAPGGAVLAAGVASDSEQAAQGADCVAEAVKALTLPDPGSYAAKVTFPLD